MERPRRRSLRAPEAPARIRSDDGCYKLSVYIFSRRWTFVIDSPAVRGSHLESVTKHEERKNNEAHPQSVPLRSGCPDVAGEGTRRARPRAFQANRPAEHNATMKNNRNESKFPSLTSFARNAGLSQIRNANSTNNNPVMSATPILHESIVPYPLPSGTFQPPRDDYSIIVSATVSCDNPVPSYYY